MSLQNSLFSKRLHILTVLLSEPEMKEFAQVELDTAKEKIESLELELQKLLLPKDPNDEKNIYLEIFFLFILKLIEFLKQNKKIF